MGILGKDQEARGYLPLPSENSLVPGLTCVASQMIGPDAAPQAAQEVQGAMRVALSSGALPPPSTRRATSFGFAALLAGGWDAGAPLHGMETTGPEETHCPYLRF